MNSRPITEDDLNAYVDQRLEAPRQTEVAAYLEAHPDVARRISVFCDQRDALRIMLGPIAEEPVPPELDLSHMIEERRQSRQTPRWILATAALFLLCIGIAGGWALRSIGLPPSRGIAALAREAAASYAVYAPDPLHPVEIRAEDRSALSTWTAKQVGRPIAIPDLTAAGYRFLGGRVVPTDHGPAVLFMYDDEQGQRLMMFARPMDTEKNMPMSPHSQDRLNGYAWADGGLGFSLVGAVPTKLLQPLARDVQRQLRNPA